MPMNRLIAVAVIAVGATACGPSIRTAIDYDRKANFANYHTFFMVKGNSSGNPLLDQRAQDDVRDALMSKGWEEAPKGDGRAAVVVHAATKTRHTYETFYDGWGGWRWRWPELEDATTYVNDYKVGTVVVDIFDAGTRQAIWHGFASDALSDSGKNDARTTQQAITKMFAKFPPGGPAQ